MKFEDIQMYVVLSVVILFVLNFVIAFFLFKAVIKLWLRAKMSGVDIPFILIILMRFRKSDPAKIVDAKIMSVQAGLDPISIGKLEAHNIAGGDSKNVVHAMIVAKNADIDVQWEDASKYDLAGRDVLEAIREEADSE